MRAVKNLRSKKIPATLELKGISTNNKPDSFPYSGIRIMGATQISSGVMAFALGLVDLVMTLTSYDADTKKFGDSYDKVVSLTLACSPLWCGIWFAVTGGLGACITRHKSQKLNFLKIAFLILNLLCCAIFAPACTFINGYISYSRHTSFDCNLQWVITLVIAFLGVLMTIIAAASAAVTCCCSPLNTGQVNVLVSPKHLTGGHLVMERDSTDLTSISSSSDDEPTEGAKRKGRTKNFGTQTKPPTIHHIVKYNDTHNGHYNGFNYNNNKNSNSHDTKGTQTAVPDVHKEPHNRPHSGPASIKPHSRHAFNKPYSGHASSSPVSKSAETHSSYRTPRAELEVPIYNTFADSSGYPKLQKWAVPPW